ncbi:MAG TPA: hypothetical protein PKK43_14865, partial [Spirochaetota bacterium]|nr:hypothetical protein [Spirochaetota bacterium]
MIDSQAWEKLSNTPEFQKLANVIYFIQLKAGTLISYRDLPSFFGGSVGLAKMGDNSMLVVAKTNLKSRAGLALVKAFKGESVPLSETKKKKEPGKEEKERKLEGVTADSYTDIFNEEQMPFGNLTITRINVSDGYIYMVLLDDYLFISDSDNTLGEALHLAAKPDSGNLLTLKGMKEALTAFENGGDVLVYANTESSTFAPILTNFVHGKGIACVLSGNATKTISGDIYAIEAVTETKTAQKGTEWEKIIPQDQAIAVYSTTVGLGDAEKNIGNLPDSWKDLKEGTSSFFSAASIDTSGYFSPGKGCALILHGLDLFNKRLYPQFAVGYDSKKKDGAVMRAIFKGRKETTQNFSGVKYSTLALDGFYKPAAYHGTADIVSSSRLNLEKYISASKGNREVLSDDPSYAALGEYAKAPNHIVISIPRAIEALRNFYIYGGIRSGGYTAKTVDRDIIPLADPVKGYETIH